MVSRTITALFAGAIIYILVIALRSAQGDLTGPQLLLMLVAPLAIGLLAGGAKKGLVLGFVVSLVMLVLEAVIIFSPGVFADPNVVAALIFMLLPFALISAALGAVGGLLGRRIFKK